MVETNCRICGGTFSPHPPNKQTCSHECAITLQKTDKFEYEIFETDNLRHITERSEILKGGGEFGIKPIEQIGAATGESRETEMGRS